MGKLKEWFKKLSLKDKIKNIAIAILSLLLAVLVSILGIIRRRTQQNRSDSRSGSFAENHKNAESTSDRVRDYIDAGRSGIDSANNSIAELRQSIDSSLRRSESIKESIIDLINKS